MNNMKYGWALIAIMSVVGCKPSSSEPPPPSVTPPDDLQCHLLATGGQVCVNESIFTESGQLVELRAFTSNASHQVRWKTELDFATVAVDQVESTGSGYFVVPPSETDFEMTVVANVFSNAASDAELVDSFAIPVTVTAHTELVQLQSPGLATLSDSNQLYVEWLPAVHKGEVVDDAVYTLYVADPSDPLTHYDRYVFDSPQGVVNVDHGQDYALYLSVDESQLSMSGLMLLTTPDNPPVTRKFVEYQPLRQQKLPDPSEEFNTLVAFGDELYVVRRDPETDELFYGLAMPFELFGDESPLLIMLMDDTLDDEVEQAYRKRALEQQALRQELAEADVIHFSVDSRSVLSVEFPVALAPFAKGCYSSSDSIKPLEYSACVEGQIRCKWESRYTSQNSLNGQCRVELGLDLDAALSTQYDTIVRLTDKKTVAALSKLPGGIGETFLRFYKDKVEDNLIISSGAGMELDIDLGIEIKAGYKVDYVGIKKVAVDFRTVPLPWLTVDIVDLPFGDHLMNTEFINPLEGLSDLLPHGTHDTSLKLGIGMYPIAEFAGIGFNAKAAGVAQVERSAYILEFADQYALERRSSTVNGSVGMFAEAEIEAKVEPKWFCRDDKQEDCPLSISTSYDWTSPTFNFYQYPRLPIAFSNQTDEQCDRQDKRWYGHDWGHYHYGELSYGGIYSTKAESYNKLVLPSDIEFLNKAAYHYGGHGTVPAIQPLTTATNVDGQLVLETPYFRDSMIHNQGIENGLMLLRLNATSQFSSYFPTVISVEQMSMLYSGEWQTANPMCWNVYSRWNQWDRSYLTDVTNPYDQIPHDQQVNSFTPTGLGAAITRSN